MLRVQVPAAKAATAFLGITRDSPQRVKGPAAAAPNRSAAAGAAPMPTSISTATSGISKSRGTLMRMPRVAATTTPGTLSPRYMATVSGVIHWMTRPPIAPARIMAGPRRHRYRRLDFIQSLMPVETVSRQVDCSDSALSPPLPKMSARRTWRRTSRATSGPSSRTPTTLTAMRVLASIGVKTSAAMTSAGRFSVEEPWVMAMAVSTGAPRFRKAEAMGTMQAEHRFMDEPTANPRSTPFMPPPVNREPLLPGKRNTSVIPAARNAKIIPTVTSFR